MKVPAIQSSISRVTTAKRWNRPWLYYIGGLFALFNAYFHARILGDAIFGDVSVHGVPIDVASGGTFVLLVGILFTAVVLVDYRWSNRFPDLDLRGAFGAIAVTTFLLAAFGWLVAILLIEASVGFPQDGIVGVLANSVSFNLVLLGASTVLLRHS
ncbi:hypothetical protein [Natronorubrum tibetense]|uniref:Uncharacterized protein n=1 Tax=Natronorubrum tibetense GA33 TaxID=1114856 RepID=L9VW08_9EURY|nr:hypothetical protein [Natronorubrum tibetense]ELY41201.1 hypothetical protein C496_09456 [Natronorubrum tibetense GA33]